MEKIQEIIYLPSLRCNLNCRHCKEIQDIKKEFEVDCCYILQKLKESFAVDDVTVIISGGEPFLNRTFSKFIIQCLEQTDYLLDITTNGYFYEEIRDLAEKIQIPDRGRIAFHVSVDGLEATHNQIRRNNQSFCNAVKTVECLAGHGMKVYINTVAQQNNLDELEKLKSLFQSISDHITPIFIPIALDIAEKNMGEVYTKEYQSKLWKYMGTDLDKKKILSKGKYGVASCHAGSKNIAIGPDGNVYACLTGAYFKKAERGKFCLGDLKECTLDEIWANKAKKEQVIENAVKHCVGCANPCEVNREVYIFGQKIEISEDELPMLFALEQEQKIGEAVLDYNGWHQIERYDNVHALCWSSALYAKIYYKKGNRKKLSISYRKITEEVKVKIFLDDREVYKDTGDQLQMQILLHLPDDREEYGSIAFLVDRLHSPYEIWGSSDKRYLGIGLSDIVFL